ncbi:(2Fe-2S)-binding protein [Thalassospiraceae bacterium LMO-JJ14]|nr:(2Fe-2S)-binding protein [Thalassospiraceae bacterium LMO-JJ14]
MLKRRHSDAAVVRISIDGEQVEARAGESVAAAVLAHTEGATRTTPLSDAPRAPYCMMGVCFECLMEIDGVANRQACMIRVADGMSVKRQQGARSVEGRE